MDIRSIIANNTLAEDITRYVINHLITQGRASVANNKWCAYRSGNGLSCAAGCLISDNDYLNFGLTIEGVGIDSVIQAEYGFLVPDNIVVEKFPQLGVLQALQQIHDLSYYDNNSPEITIDILMKTLRSSGHRPDMEEWVNTIEPILKEFGAK